MFEAFLAKVDFSGDCWNWKAYKDKHGYGQFCTGQQPKKCHRAYRWMFERCGFVIPPGMEAHHLCRNRACVNPFHLEVVTHAENNRRGDGWGGRHARATHCPSGHPYSTENTYLRPRSGHRVCRTCHREAERKRVANRA